MNPSLYMSSTLPDWHAVLVLGPAVAAGAAALLAWAGGASSVAWRGARWGSSAALLCSVLSMIAVFSGSSGVAYGLRADALGGIVMLLVAFIGWVIVRYSQPYLNGERARGHYARWLMATLATVGVVVASNHLLVLALAWMATSLSVRRLLTFFGDRPPAVLAAHKKRIVSRAADLCMLAAAGLLAAAFGTLHIDRIVALAAAAPRLPLQAQAAVLMVVLAALLKSAQLPFHGWLIQVMEAPTPVSALLHAGVVNLGGFVLLRLAPLVAEVLAAQLLLVATGAATAVLAALVMSTRISTKVMLAWSTCAQMGFMLMQCGLGAWEMALLHLVAHSLYKAHAFLAAGGAVRRTMLVKLTPQAEAPGPLALAAGALAGGGMTLAAWAAWSQLMPAQSASPAIGVLAGVVAFALVSLVHAQSWRLGGFRLALLGLGAFAVAFAYFGLHALFATWVPSNTTVSRVPLWIGVAVAFCLLFLLQSLVIVSPQGALTRILYPWFYGGLFLDEKFNQIALGLWPPPQPAASPAPLPVEDSTIATVGARA